MTNRPVTMKAYRLHGVEDLRLEELAVPRPGPGELLIRVSRVGICGTDVHYFAEGRCGAFVMRHPFIPGHEFAGRVAGWGEAVGGFEQGQRVAVDPSRPCGRCAMCRAGRANLCRSMRYYGTASVNPHADGALAEYVTAPADNCHALAETVDDRQAATLEPTAIALHAINRSGGVAGRSVLVLGGGPIGQLAMLLARARGARWVGLSDPRPLPRRFAEAHGADATFDPATGPLAEQLTGSTGDAAQVVLECSGAAAAVVDALEVAAVGGTVVQVGSLAEPVTMPANRVMTGELAYVGSFRFAGTFGEALEMVADGQVDVAPVVTDVFAFEAMAEAMARARSGEAIKVHVALGGQ